MRLVSTFMCLFVRTYITQKISLDFDEILHVVLLVNYPPLGRVSKSGGRSHCQRSTIFDRTRKCYGIIKYKI